MAPNESVRPTAIFCRSNRARGRIMEVYLNIAETGIGTYGANAASQRYFGHDAAALSPTEAARIAAILPLPKKRGAISPKGFTRRYGNSIAGRVGVVGRQSLDACVYKGSAAPVDRAPPPSRAPKQQLPGSEYETATPPPPEPNVDETPIAVASAPGEASPAEQNGAAPAASENLN